MNKDEYLYKMHVWQTELDYIEAKIAHYHGMMIDPHFQRRKIEFEGRIKRLEKEKLKVQTRIAERLLVEGE